MGVNCLVAIMSQSLLDPLNREGLPVLSLMWSGQVIVKS